MDRSDSYNAQGGPLFSEIRSAMFDQVKKPKLINYIYGLGGRDIGLKELNSVYTDLANADKMAAVNYLGVRE